MNAAAIQTPPPAPFDSLAATYDDVFTNTLIGRAQRNSVWRVIDSLWRHGDIVLELNCGTGEDAIHLASRGVRVFACDESNAMIETARRKYLHANVAGTVDFCTVANENLGELPLQRQFDGVLSNFSGLNCACALGDIAHQLATFVRPDAPVVLCFSARYCGWEFLWHALRGDFAKAIRRWKGYTEANVGGRRVHVRYPTVRQIEQAFSPWFRLEHIKGIGVFVPPSYVESWITRRRRLFAKLVALDKFLSSKPFFRVLGDHVLLRFRRCAA